MIMWATFILSSAAAQVPDVSNLNAQLFRPSVDARHTLWTDDTGDTTSSPFQGRLLASYDRNLLRYSRGDGTEEGAVLRNSSAAYLIGSGQVGALRLGVQAPIILIANGEGGTTESGLGDLAIDLRWTAFSAERNPIGLAWAARATLPTSSLEWAPLASPALTVEAQGILERPFGNLNAVVNVGIRAQRKTTIEAVSVNDVAFMRLGLGYALTEQHGLSAELAAHLHLNAVEARSLPAEVLVGGWAELSDSLTLRGGVGTGVSPGVGAPLMRAVAGLSWAPKSSEKPLPDPDPDPVVEDPDPVVDPIPDPVPEPTPDPPALDVPLPVQVRAVNPSDHTIERATLILETPDGAVVGPHPLQTDLLPGEYNLKAHAPGYARLETTIQVDPGEEAHIFARMTPNPKIGVVTLIVVNLDGDPMDSAVWSVGNRLPTAVLPGGVAHISLKEGEHVVNAGAEGHLAVRLPIEVEGSNQVNLLITLVPES